jgi:hypothetical protein
MKIPKSADQKAVRISRLSGTRTGPAAKANLNEGKLEQELAETRKNAWTPEQKADYEHAAAVRRKFDFASDPDFQAKFHVPLTHTFHNLLSEAVDALPDRGAAQAWAKYIADNYTPDQLDKSWWNHSVIDKVPEETERAALHQSVAHLLRMRERTGDPAAKRDKALSNCPERDQ